MQNNDDDDLERDDLSLIGDQEGEEFQTMGERGQQIEQMRKKDGENEKNLLEDNEKNKQDDLDNNRGLDWWINPVRGIDDEGFYDL